ncbi:MAG: hypothetical protein AB7J46_06625 [Candidatus Altimarinota bacterium]
MSSATTILLYSLSGAGKTTQIGKLAEEVYVTTGKKTRVCSGDFGGTDTIEPYRDLDIIDLVEIGPTDPWVFINKVVRGYTRDASGKWVKDEKKNAEIGMYAFESAHGLAQLLQNDMDAKAGAGNTIGGDTNASFEVSGDGEKFKVGAAKGFGKYAIPQKEILKAMYESFKLPAQYVVWTAGVDVGKEELSKASTVGPLIIGGALTTLLPKDFNYTFHLDVIVEKGKTPRHVMYLGTHQDPNAGGMVALGNIRRPLDAPELKTWVIEPTDLPKAIKMLQLDAKEEAKKAIQKRLEAAKKGATVTK